MYQDVKPIRLGKQHWTLDEYERSWQSNAVTSAQVGWSSDIYERVFLKAGSAEMWQKWHRYQANMLKGQYAYVSV